MAQIFWPPPPTHPPTPIPSPGAVTLAFPLSSSELQSLSSPLPVRVSMSESSQLFILQSMPPPQGLSPLHLFAREPCLLCESGWSKGFAMGMVTIVGKKVEGALSASNQNLCPLGIGSGSGRNGVRSPPFCFQHFL